MGLLQHLMDQGHTVAAIEHYLAFIAAADFIIELGPEGGERGGQVVAAGTPQALLRFKDRSHTARTLAAALSKRNRQMDASREITAGVDNHRASA